MYTIGIGLHAETARQYQLRSFNQAATRILEYSRACAAVGISVDKVQCQQLRELNIMESDALNAFFVGYCDSQLISQCEAIHTNVHYPVTQHI